MRGRKLVGAFLPRPPLRGVTDEGGERRTRRKSLRRQGRCRRLPIADPAPPITLIRELSRIRCRFPRGTSMLNRAALALFLVPSLALAADPGPVPDKNLDAAIKAAMPHHK